MFCSAQSGRTSGTMDSPHYVYKAQGGKGYSILSVASLRIRGSMRVATRLPVVPAQPRRLTGTSAEVKTACALHCCALGATQAAQAGAVKTFALSEWRTRGGAIRSTASRGESPPRPGEYDPVPQATRDSVTTHNQAFHMRVLSPWLRGGKSLLYIYFLCRPSLPSMDPPHP